jgi:hypothetical protein
LPFFFGISAGDDIAALPSVVSVSGTVAPGALVALTQPKVALFGVRSAVAVVAGGTDALSNKRTAGRKRGGINTGLEFHKASRTTQWRRWNSQGAEKVLAALGASSSDGL